MIIQVVESKVGITWDFFRVLIYITGAAFLLYLYVLINYLEKLPSLL